MGFRWATFHRNFPLPVVGRLLISKMAQPCNYYVIEVEDKQTKFQSPFLNLFLINFLIFTFLCLHYFIKKIRGRNSNLCKLFWEFWDPGFPKILFAENYNHSGNIFCFFISFFTRQFWRRGIQSDVGVQDSFPILHHFSGNQSGHYFFGTFNTFWKTLKFSAWYFWEWV